MRKKIIFFIPALLITFLLFPCSDSTDDGYIFKYSNSQPEHHPRSKSMTFFKKELEKRTNGKIKVQLYFSAVLGTEFEVQDMEKIPEAVAGFVVALSLPPVVMLIFIVFIILLAGTFIDVSPAILLLTPVFLPACVAVGISPIQFGAILISALAVGAVTPPVGTCINVASAISGLGIGSIFRGTMP